MNFSKTIVTTNLEKDISTFISKQVFDKLFILTDSYTYKAYLPLLYTMPALSRSISICIKASDGNKNIENLSKIWQELSTKGATRHSLLINLGGGMITDLGGFAASTFKRGITYINIPTTLLAMVDAAIGGKTGINFNGLKNELGSFYPSKYTLINTDFLKTLDHSNFLSGYAEMIKHSLLSATTNWAELIKFDVSVIDYKKLSVLIKKSIQIKKSFVRKDPLETGMRKALNLGHTIGHAFESFAITENFPIPHGYAIAWGIICELYYSYLKFGFPKDKLKQTISFIKDNYGVFHFNCNHYDILYQLMKHDKKNSFDTINFTLLRDIGEIQTDQPATKKEIFELFDFYREYMEI